MYKHSDIRQKNSLYFFNSIILLFLYLSSNGQDFTTTIDKVNKVKTITFIDKRDSPRIPIILKKSYSTDTASKSETKIEIGLYDIINLVAVDYFMLDGGYIVFEDNTIMHFADKLSNIFLSGGKHQISIKHTLTKPELKELQSKKIDYFVLGKIKSNVDRFEKDFIRNLFIKIESE